MNLQAIKSKTQVVIAHCEKTIVSAIRGAIDAFKHPSKAMKCFYLLLLLSLGCFGYTWLTQGFTVPLSGDYSLQEMTFIFNGYDDWHYFFKTGVFPQWDRSVFLGMDNVGGNSFYYLFDPFVLILLPFPQDWLLVLQGLEFMLKMVLAGMFFYWFLGEFNLSSKTRTIGAMAFAFSGYSMVYLWFHFISSVAFLPLCFLGIERIIRRKDPRIFLIGFLLVAMTSYYFFVVYMIGLFIYALFRYFQDVTKRTYEDNMSILAVGMLAFIVAVMLGCFVLLPGMNVAISMPRVESDSYLETLFGSTSLLELLKNTFLFDRSHLHNQVTPLLNLLFMPDGCYYSNLLNVNYYDNLAGSLYATTPMLLIFFTGLFDSIRRRKWSHIIGFLGTGFLTFTPFGFYLFSAFTVPYARFFIIPLTYMIIYDCLTIQRRREIARGFVDLSFIVTSILYAVSCYLIIYEVDLYPSRFTDNYWDLKMFLIVGSFIWLVLCYLLIRHLFHKKSFYKVTTALMAFDIIVMCNLTIYGHGLSRISQYDDYDIETKIVERIKESEGGEDFYRIYNTTATRNNSNVPLREGYSGLSDFHSVYPYNAQDFLDRSRIPHGYHNWSMGIYNRRMNLETFLGTKYYLVNRVDDHFEKYDIPYAYGKRNQGTKVSDYDIPYGYKNVLDLTEEEIAELGVDFSSDFLSLLSECSKSLYINTNFIDLGFAYDTVINSMWLASSINTTTNTYSWNLYEDLSEYPLLRYAMLDNDDYQTFYKAKKYNAGSVNHFGNNLDDVAIDTSDSTLSAAASRFQRSLTFTNGDYVPYDENADYYNDTTLTKPSNPIQIYTATTSRSTRMKITVYESNWPATSERPSGQYAVCDPDDYYNQDCISEWKEQNPFLYANWIRPADTKYDFMTRKDDDGKTSEEYDNKVLSYSKLVLEAYDGSGKQTVFCPDADPSDPNTGCYISIFDTDNIEWRLYDENDTIISFAKHPYVEYKSAHGYYTDRPVKTIIGIVQSGTKDNPVSLKTPYVYIQRCSDYQRTIDELKANQIDIIERDENHTVFTTDYQNDKFLVLNYPYQNGWSVKEEMVNSEGEVEYEEQTLYKAQGGFIGFEAKKGDHKYVLEYNSPYLKFGSMLTCLGLFITSLVMAFFYFRDRNSKLISSVNLKGKSEDFINHQKHRYEDCESDVRY